MPTDYYQILSIPKEASDAQIKKAYKEKALKYHPDINKEENSAKYFQLINEAYHVLINSESRKKYDFQLKYSEFLTSTTDIKRRHPADARYYERKKQGFTGQKTNPGKNHTANRNFNYFIFYSILTILVLGIIFGLYDAIRNFKIMGLIFCIFTLIIFLSGVRIIKREKRKNGKS